MFTVNTYRGESVSVTCTACSEADTIDSRVILDHETEEDAYAAHCASPYHRETVAPRRLSPNEQTKGREVLVVPVTFIDGDPVEGKYGIVAMPTRWEGDEQWTGIRFPDEGTDSLYAIEPWRVFSY